MSASWQPVRSLPSAGTCPGHGPRWPLAAARGPAHRALGMAHPCRCPSVLGHRGCSVALCPWGLSLLLQRESIGASQTPPRCSWPPPLSILSLSSPPVCVAHRPGGPLCQASAFPYQPCLLVLPFVGCLLWWGTMEATLLEFLGGQAESWFSWDSQILQLWTNRSLKNLGFYFVLL